MDDSEQHESYYDIETLEEVHNIVEQFFNKEVNE